MLDKVAIQTEVLNYSETYDVYVADRWKERLRSYLGRSHGHIQNNKIFAGMVETRFIMRSQQRS
jgi:hypothetical protein